MHQCHNREWYLRVYNHVLEPLNGKKYRKKTQEIPLLSYIAKFIQERSKKKEHTK